MFICSHFDWCKIRFQYGHETMWSTARTCTAHLEIAISACPHVIDGTRSQLSRRGDWKKQQHGRMKCWLLNFNISELFAYGKIISIYIGSHRASHSSFPSWLARIYIVLPLTLRWYITHVSDNTNAVEMKNWSSLRFKSHSRMIYLIQSKAKRNTLENDSERIQISFEVELR